MRNKIFLFAILLLATLAPGFAFTEEDAQAKIYRTLEALLPNPADFGANPNGEPYFYAPSNLYEYINGAADSYTQYDFEGLAGIMMLKDGVDLTADIYGMGTPLNAFGIYSAERSPDFQFLPIGLQANGDEGTLHFLQQQYYVKLSAFGDKEACVALMKTVAESISKKIGEINKFPQELNLFPAKNKVENSEKYWKKNAMGISFLRETFATTYRYDEEESVVMVSTATDAKEAQAWMPLYQAHFQKLRSEIKPLDQLGEEAFESSSKYEGTSIVVRKGKYVLVLSKPVPGAVAALEGTLKAIPDEKKGVSK